MTSGESASCLTLPMILTVSCSTLSWIESPTSGFMLLGGTIFGLWCRVFRRFLMENFAF